MLYFDIRSAPLLGPDFEAVFNEDDKCIGVVNNSRRAPWKRAFFAYNDGCFYYGMTSQDAVLAFFSGGEE